MNDFKSKLYRFMYGRYGSDNLNMFLMVLAVLGLLVNTFLLKNSIFTFGIWGILVLSVYRTYSRNITKRRNENATYLRITRPFRKRYLLLKKQSQDKNHKYYLCPDCRQVVRVPKGRGKITITCPSCKKTFDRKS